MIYYGIDYDDSSLTHYGVKGMKWGVRKKIQSYRTKRNKKWVDKQIAKGGKDYANQKNYERLAKSNMITGPT